MNKLLLLLAIVFVVGLSFLTPIRSYFSPEGFGALQNWISAQGILAPFVFGVIYVCATVFVLPGSVLTIVGGLLFGALWGTVINLVSATIGALISFLIARYLGREFVEKFLRGKGRLGDLDAKIGTGGFYFIMTLRLIPLFPFNVLNYGLGLTKISFKDYALASLVGMLPGTFVYTSLGAAGQHVSLTDPQTLADYRVWGPFLMVIILSLVPKLIKNHNKSHVKS